MKCLITAALIILIAAGMARAAETSLVGGDRPIQTFAPNGTLTQLLTINSSTVDLSAYSMFGVYTPTSTTCFMRMMPTTAKGARVAATVPVTTWTIRAKNPATSFLNLSGCAGGYLQIQ